MFNPATLRSTCIRKSCDLLISGAWDKCKENPFSCMPSSVVDDHLSTMWPEGSKVSRESITHSSLLLTSGRLENFELPRAEDSEAYVKLLQILSRGCQNLRTLSLLWGNKVQRVRLWLREKRSIHAEWTLQELLQNCAKLEYLHSCIYFEPNALRKCINLKVLRLHFSTADSLTFTHHIASDLLKSLGAIEVFAFCKQFGFNKKIDELSRETVPILDNYPQLTSLGSIDSLATLKELHDKDLRILGTPRRFQLRGCCWDIQEDISQSEYCDMIRVAALSCPVMEVLMVRVQYVGGLQHLRELRNLTLLDINLFFCRDDPEDEFYSLLEEIGPQLRHLSITDGNSSKPLSLNITCRNCPNLSTLQLICSVTADEDSQLNLLNLECLNVCVYNKSIIFLLSNCLHLKMLILDNCQQLEDSALHEILRKNPFAKLEVAYIRQSSLTESGWASFVRNAVKLSKCCFKSDLLGDDEVMQCVRGLNPRVVFLSPSDIYELKNDYIPTNRLASCSL